MGAGTIVTQFASEVAVMTESSVNRQLDLGLLPYLRRFWREARPYDTPGEHPESRTFVSTAETVGES